MGRADRGRCPREFGNAERVDEEGGGSNAKEFLRYLLTGGSMPASQLFRDGEAHGCSKRQLQRARADICATIDKLGMQGGWQWTLPKMPLSPKDTEDALSAPLGIPTLDASYVFGGSCCSHSNVSLSACSKDTLRPAT